jgi:hypothetical protein
MICSMRFSADEMNPLMVLRFNLRRISHFNLWKNLAFPIPKGIEA